MRGCRQITWFLIGFAMAALLGAVMRVETAAAQSTLTRIAPPPVRRQEPPRRPVPPSPVDAVDADTDRLVPPTTRISRPSADASDPSDADLLADGDDPAASAARRNGDGQPADGFEATVQRDGDLDTGEPNPAPRDGEPDADVEPRLKSDIDAFEAPPAGYDALAFQIDDVSPILDRRPQRLARFEPYDPAGVRSGNWVIYPEIETGAGWLSNVFRSPAKTSSTFFDVRPTIRAVTNWRRHAVDLRATGLLTSFTDASSENDRAYALEARGRLDLSRRTNVEAAILTRREQDSRTNRDAASSARERADVVTSTAAVALNHRFNRLSLQLRGSVSDIDYEPVAALDGTIISNDPRDLVVRETAARATWEFKPTLFAFTDVAVNDRRYRTAPADGIARDSRGWRWLAGLGFGSTGTTWRGEIGIGYGEQTPEAVALRAVSGVLLEANLAWRPTAMTSFLLTARTDFADSTTPGQSGSTVRQLGIEARHAFRRHLIGIAGVRYVDTAYEGAGLTERETISELGFEYFVSREWTLDARYAHTVFDSSAIDSDFTNDRVRVGLRWRR